MYVRRLSSSIPLILMKRDEQVFQSFYNGQPELQKVGRIVNKVQWARVISLLSSTRGKIVAGGSSHEEALFIEPTIVQHVPLDDPLLEAEIFGPILPIVKANDLDHAREIMTSLSPDPLGFYVFSEDPKEASQLVAASRSGSASINDVMGQIAPTSLPFGGFGQSGMGSYRGRASIHTFSHLQSVVSVSTSAEIENMLEWRYPYSEAEGTVAFVKENLQVKLV
jgi:acyl-CoA reductase-like NAD-dependent aldehyde dehydrogenase